MNPVTEFCSYVFMGNFSPVDRDEFKKHDQNGESKASLFKRFRPGHRAEVFIWSLKLRYCSSLLNEVSYTSL